MDKGHFRVFLCVFGEGDLYGDITQPMSYTKPTSPIFIKEAVSSRQGPFALDKRSPTRTYSVAELDSDRQARINIRIPDCKSAHTVQKVNNKYNGTMVPM